MPRTTITTTMIYRRLWYRTSSSQTNHALNRGDMLRTAISAISTTTTTTITTIGMWLTRLQDIRKTTSQSQFLLGPREVINPATLQAVRPSHGTASKILSPPQLPLLKRSSIFPTNLILQTALPPHVRESHLPSRLLHLLLPPFRPLSSAL